MNVFGQLKRACLEILSGSPSGNVTGRIWWRSDTGRAEIDSGTQKRAFLLNDDKAIIGTSGTASDNVRLNRAGVGVIQYIAGNDSTAEGSLSTAPVQTSSRLENYTDSGKPAFGNAGRLAYITDLFGLALDIGTVWKYLVDKDTAQTLTNKTVSAASNMISGITNSMLSSAGQTDGKIMKADGANGVVWIDPATQTSVKFTPQAADPISPTAGQMFYADGTSRPTGAWIYDGAVWKRLSGITTQTFTSNGTFTVPTDVTEVFVTICGGGGGGGGSAGGGVGTFAGGGGGGSGAQVLIDVPVTVTPGGTCAVTVGPGGAGGTGGSSGGGTGHVGTDGTGSVFVGPSKTIRAAGGAGGGGSGGSSGGTDGNSVFGIGGQGSATAAGGGGGGTLFSSTGSDGAATGSSVASAVLCSQNGGGGTGGNSSSSRSSGNGGTSNYSNGSSGATASATGGSSGGGGGAYGLGADGVAGVGSAAASAGNSAAANTGGGGSGAGGRAFGGSAGGVVGGSGGSGIVIVRTRIGG